MGQPVLVGTGEVCVLMAFMLLHHSPVLLGATLDSPNACRVGLETNFVCVEMSPVDYCEVCGCSDLTRARTCRLFVSSNSLQ